MAPTLFGEDIRGVIGEAFEGQLVPLTFTKRLEGTRDSDTLERRPSSSISYSGEGSYRAKASRNPATGLSDVGESINIIAASLEVIASPSNPDPFPDSLLPENVIPEAGDSITYEGTEFAITGVEYSAARASFKCGVSCT